MSEGKDRTIFGDRRSGRDRRRQNLPMPAGLDRRKNNSRRNRSFSAQPWWLKIDYAEELIGEKTSPTQPDSTPASQPASRKPSDRS